MTGLVDLHHHLLPGLDDGAADMEATAAMLQRAAAQGVRYIAATPHMTPGVTAFDPEAYQQARAAAEAYISRENLPVTLFSGVEVFYTQHTIRYLEQGRIPTLGDSWHVLVEFHPHDRYEVIWHAVMNVANAGYGVVLAHAERYRALRWGDRLAQLREQCHLKVQMNSSAVLKAHEGWGDRWIKRMIREGNADIIASDAHNTGVRSCTLGRCAALLADTYGQETADRLCSAAAYGILHEKDERSWLRNREEGKA